MNKYRISTKEIGHGANRSLIAQSTEDEAAAESTEVQQMDRAILGHASGL